jgi:hypothetical protein
MDYGKLEKLLKEICEKKSIDQHDLRKEWIKKYISENVDLCEDKYYIKYGTEKDSVLIFGDDGKFYELSDGSLIQKEVFDKIYRNEESEIVINPNEFFGSTKIKIVRPLLPKYDKPKDFLKGDNTWQNLAGFFKDLDITKIKFHNNKK